MPTYEYECETCGLKFERRQAIKEPPLQECPVCRGRIHRLASGGLGFFIKGSSRGPMREDRGGCSWEQSGKTCCGREEPCDKPPCREDS